MGFIADRGLFPAVRFSMLALTALNKNKAYGLCSDGQIGCDASLLEAGADPDRQVSCMAIAQPIFGLNSDFQVKNLVGYEIDFFSLEK